MLLHYQEKRKVTRNNLEQELAYMGITRTEYLKIIKEIIDQKGEAIISHYQFDLPAGEQGAIMVCHDLGRGVISSGAISRWGQWDEMYEVLTLDETAEKFNFDGKPVYEGDDGACSLGNI